MGIKGADKIPIVTEGKLVKLARMFHESPSRDRIAGLATGYPRGDGSLTVRRKDRHPRTPGYRLVEPIVRREG